MSIRWLLSAGLVSLLGCGDPAGVVGEGTEEGTEDTGAGEAASTTRPASSSSGASEEASSGGGPTSTSDDASSSSGGPSEPPPPLDCDEATLTDLPRGEWTTFPGTQLGDVCACNDGFPDVCGSSGCDGLFAWSGGVVDRRRKRFLHWGGGHNDYYGNEFYAFDVESRGWERLGDPSDPGDVSTCAEILADGTPPSRHTYEGLTYLADDDVLFAIGGAHACADGGFSDHTWTYDFGSGTWSVVEPTYVGFGGDPVGDIFGYGSSDIVAEWDPVSGEVFVETTFSFSSYDYASNTWTNRLDLFNEFGGRWAQRGGILLPDERIFLSVGSGTTYAYDLDAFTYEEWATTGGDEIVDAAAPGLTYDDVTQQVVAFAGGAMYTLDVETRAWSEVGQALAPSTGSGLYGRFAYLECEDAFLLIDDTAYADVRVFRK